MKRSLDVLLALLGLLVSLPVQLPLMLAIALQDFGSPFYAPPRAARGGGTFTMLKLRSMVSGADRKGGSSTAATDRRITPLGRFVRRWKLDELPQLWNVLGGSMSFVGPRPQVLADTQLYTAAERRLLEMRPGITDLASIVFADEGDILAGAADPDLLYNQIIRPWKSRLALLYFEHDSAGVYLRLLQLTAIGLVSRQAALAGVQRLLAAWQVDAALCAVARRDAPLPAAPPPGAAEVVSRAGLDALAEAPTAGTLTPQSG